MDVENLEKTTRRLTIFTFNDKEGIVDNYINYCLVALRPFSTFTVVVSRSNLSETGKKKLYEVADDLIFEKNYTTNTELLNYFFSNKFGKDISEYDELLICDDTIYGPFQPLSEIFNKMDNIATDFWGLMYNFNICFYAIRKHIFESNDFKQILHNLNSFPFGRSLFNKLNELGYKYSVYMEQMHNPVQALKEQRLPFLNKTSFSTDREHNLNFSGNENTNKIMELISKKTNYDINLIWAHLLRTCNITDIKNTLHLQYIFPVHSQNRKQETSKKVLILAHLYYVEHAQECFEYIKNAPDFIDIIIATSVDELRYMAKEYFKVHKNVEVRKVNNHGRDIATLLVACREDINKYDFICFTHDKGAKKNDPTAHSDSFRYLLWENTLASKNYIENVLEEFNKTPQLGLLHVPQPYHYSALSIMGNEWALNFENVISLANRLDLNVDISIDKQPFTLGTAFWCRTDAMRKLFEYNWQYSDFPQEPLGDNNTISHAIERILAYVAQDRGYFSGICLSSSYVAVRGIDLEEIIRGMLDVLRSKAFIFTRYLEIPKLLLQNQALSDIGLTDQKLYIYGIGVHGETAANGLNNQGIVFEGFIITDGYANPREFLNKPVLFLSEVDFNVGHVSVIVAVHPRNKSNIVCALEDIGSVNII